jgi:hypothetical protein
MARDLPPSLERLMDDNRVRRQELHDLVDRLRRERGRWDEEAQMLPQRERLTIPQRQQFRVLLTRLRRRQLG